MAQYLVEHHGFVHVSVTPKQTAFPHEQAANEAGTPNTHHRRDAARSALTFATSDELLEHVTQRWRDRWVATGVMSKDVLDTYSRRPFFLLISVDAPLLVRWKRYQQRSRASPSHSSEPPPPPSLSSLKLNGTGAEQGGECWCGELQCAQTAAAAGHTTSASVDQSADPNTRLGPGPGPGPMTLESFAALSDAQLYHPLTGQATHISSAPVRLLNTSQSLASLYVNLGKLDLLSQERLRPSWDNYFMSLASLAAQRSNCMKRRVGCVVVSHNRRVISTGYNGTPRGIRNCGEGGCGRCNSGLGSGHGLTTCLCIHAEENALLEAGRDRLREGAVLYCDTCPCLTCSIKIAQVGVSEVVYAYGYSMDGETAAVFREAGVLLRQFVPVSPPVPLLFFLLGPLPHSVLPFFRCVKHSK